MPVFACTLIPFWSFLFDILDTICHFACITNYAPLSKEGHVCPPCSWAAISLFCPLSEMVSKSKCWAWERRCPKGCLWSVKYSTVDNRLQHWRNTGLMNLRCTLRSLILCCGMKCQEAFLEGVKLKYQYGFDTRILKQYPKGLESSSSPRQRSWIPFRVAFSSDEANARSAQLVCLLPLLDIYVEVCGRFTDILNFLPVDLRLYPGPKFLCSCVILIFHVH